MSDVDDDRDTPVRTREADRTSYTRFGPRPVPEGHRPHVDRHVGPYESRRIPPSGPVSPDGSRPWPAPSKNGRLLVWSGTAVAAAAVTALAVHLGRRLGETLQDDTPAPTAHRKPSAPPRFAELSEDERAALRARARRAARAAQDAVEEEAPRMRRPPAPKIRRRRPKADFSSEVNQRTRDLSHGVGNVMSSLTAALTGFRAVAGQAGHIMREFNDAASLIGGFMGRTAQAARDAAGKATRETTDAVREAADDVGKKVQEERRTHRL